MWTWQTARCLVNPGGRPEILPQSALLAVQGVRHRHSPMATQPWSQSWHPEFTDKTPELIAYQKTIVRAQRSIVGEGLSNV